jgi:branched-chain amino acid transport system ATP-binding protein
MALPSDIPLLRLEKISKRFGGLLALSEVDLSLTEGEIVGLLGPNGAGKSTLFNVITSIYRPDAGDIYLRGQKITGRAPHKICHLGISRTFQLVRAFLSMTALENVLVGSIYGRKLRGKEARRRAMEAMELVELADKKDVVAGHMTLSDRRLLEVARALASLPSVTLLDEPMAGLNPAETDKVLRVIEKARAESSLTIVWVEHKVDAIFNLCERVVVLDYGRKIAEGKSEEVAKNPKVIEAYLGESPA